MHIPSHTLKPEIALSACAITVPVLIWAAKKANLEKEKVLQLSAGVFLLLGLQAFNLPIAGGTSSHLLGGTLLAILFGPCLSALGMASVFIIQALLLGDGGWDALGANILNGGLVGAFAGYGLYRVLAGKSSGWRRSLAAFAASATAFQIGAVFCAAELSFSGFAPFGATLSAMTQGSSNAALLEGGLTVLALQGVWALERESLSLRKISLALAGAGALLAGFAPLAASKLPDPLDKVLSEKNLLQTER